MEYYRKGTEPTEYTPDVTSLTRMSSISSRRMFHSDGGIRHSSFADRPSEDAFIDALKRELESELVSG